MRWSKESASQNQVGNAEQRQQLGVVLRQAAIARLAMLEQALHDMKAMLDFRTHAGLGLLQLFLGAPQRILLERTAHTRAHRDVPVDYLARVLRALANALITSVSQHGFLAAMQQRMRLGDVRHIASRADYRVHQASSHIHAHVRLHAEVPVVAFLRLMHVRIAFLVAVLCRRRCRNQGGVHDRPLAHDQTFAGQVHVDFIEDPTRQIVLLQQPTELQQRRRIWRRFVCQIDADETTNGLAVVDRIFDSLVRQTEALLGDVHAQHALQAHRRAASPIALRVVRQQRGDQRRPRGRGLDLGQEALASRQLFLAGELRVGKARLLHRMVRMMGCVIVPVARPAGGVRRLNQCFPRAR